jgi:hypothetical protein
MKYDSNTGDEYSRFNKFDLVVRLIDRYPYLYFFGYGRCSASASNLGASFTGELAARGISIPSPAFHRTLLELGVSGLLLFLAFGFRCILLGIVRKNSLLFGAGIVYVVMSFYGDPWSFNLLAFLFCFIITYVHKYGRNAIALS